MRMKEIGITVLILVLLVALGAAGEYNYQRNLAAEESKAPRTYRGYSDQEIAALIDAYQQEVDVLEARYGAAESHTLEANSGSLIDERIREFERAQESGSSTRSMRGELAKQEAILRELRREQSLRRGGGDSLMLHLRRLVTI